MDKIEGVFTMLFLLEPIEDWEPWYDKAFGFVIRASTEVDARQLASQNAGDEGKDVWLDAAKTRCQVIDPNGPPNVLCRDFASA
jgi:hypothetical protein